jgi:hypothetical protein
VPRHATPVTSPLHGKGVFLSARPVASFEWRSRV